MGLLGSEGWRRFGLLVGGVIGWVTWFGFVSVGCANDAEVEGEVDGARGCWGADVDAGVGVEVEMAES